MLAHYPTERHASVLAEQHSRFGNIVPSKHLNILPPYLDPRQALPRKHIEKAAEKTEIPAAELDKILADLSSHMGWDVTKGSAQ
ncbi:MAG: hypothetical protein R8K20_01260 [Gallionellaceae bacterium]